MLTCQICNKQYKHLSSHVFMKHKMLSREYKEKFELPYNSALISEDIRQKKRLAIKKSPTWKENFKESKKYQFYKGMSGHRRISKIEMIKNIKTITRYNDSLDYKPCPICKVKYKHLNSHLFNKHGLIKVDNAKY